MARKGGTPENLKHFVKGQSGNPGGVSKYGLSRGKVTKIVAELVEMTSKQLQKLSVSQDSTMLQRTIAAILLKAEETGDYSRLEFLLARSIGKVKDSLEVSTIKPYIIHRPDGSALELGAKQEVIDGDIEDGE